MGGQWRDIYLYPGAGILHKGPCAISLHRRALDTYWKVGMGNWGRESPAIAWRGYNDSFIHSCAPQYVLSSSSIWGTTSRVLEKTKLPFIWTCADTTRIHDRESTFTEMTFKVYLFCWHIYNAHQHKGKENEIRCQSPCGPHSSRVGDFPAFSPGLPLLTPTVPSHQFLWDWRFCVCVVEVQLRARRRRKRNLDLWNPERFLQEMPSGHGFPLGMLGWWGKRIPRLLTSLRGWKSNLQYRVAKTKWFQERMRAMRWKKKSSY